MMTSTIRVLPASDYVNCRQAAVRRGTRESGALAEGFAKRQKFVVKTGDEIALRLEFCGFDL
jgi:hypothetical protein